MRYLHGRLVAQRAQGPSLGPAQPIERIKVFEPQGEIHVLALVPQRDPRATVRPEAGHFLVFTVRGCVGLFAESDLTPTLPRRHRRYPRRRRPVIGNIRSGGKQQQDSGGVAGTIQSMFALFRHIQLMRAVRRIHALLRSHQQTGVAEAVCCGETRPPVVTPPPPLVTASGSAFPRLPGTNNGPPSAGRCHSEAPTLPRPAPCVPRLRRLREARHRGADPPPQGGFVH